MSTPPRPDSDEDDDSTVKSATSSRRRDGDINWSANRASFHRGSRVFNDLRAYDLSPIFEELLFAFEKKADRQAFEDMGLAPNGKNLADFLEDLYSDLLGVEYPIYKPDTTKKAYDRQITTRTHVASVKAGQIKSGYALSTEAREYNRFRALCAYFLQNLTMDDRLYDDLTTAPLPELPAGVADLYSKLIDADSERSAESKKTVPALFTARTRSILDPIFGSGSNGAKLTSADKNLFDNLIANNGRDLKIETEYFYVRRLVGRGAVDTATTTPGGSTGTVRISWGPRASYLLDAVSDPSKPPQVISKFVCAAYRIARSKCLPQRGASKMAVDTLGGEDVDPDPLDALAIVAKEKLEISSFDFKTIRGATIKDAKLDGLKSGSVNEKAVRHVVRFVQDETRSSPLGQFVKLPSPTAPMPSSNSKVGGKWIKEFSDATERSQWTALNTWFRGTFVNWWDKYKPEYKKPKVLLYGGKKSQGKRNMRPNDVASMVMAHKLGLITIPQGGTQTDDATVKLMVDKYDLDTHAKAFSAVKDRLLKAIPPTPITSVDTLVNAIKGTDGTKISNLNNTGEGRCMLKDLTNAGLSRNLFTRSIYMFCILTRPKPAKETTTRKTKRTNVGSPPGKGNLPSNQTSKPKKPAKGNEVAADNAMQVLYTGFRNAYIAKAYYAHKLVFGQDGEAGASIEKAGVSRMTLAFLTYIWNAYSSYQNMRDEAVANYTNFLDLLKNKDASVMGNINAGFKALRKKYKVNDSRSQHDVPSTVKDLFNLRDSIMADIMAKRGNDRELTYTLKGQLGDDDKVARSTAWAFITYYNNTVEDKFFLENDIDVGDISE